MKLVFYISGHGYGHAVRDIEIIKSILAIEPRTEIHFRTKAPQWLFQPLLNDHVFYHERELDFGVLQQNSFSADKKNTLERYAGLIEQKDQLVNEEIDFLTSVQPDIILDDITPFAFDAADAFGKKAIATGNFSWDWIYSDYLADLPEYDYVVQDIKQSYAKSERLYRIPFYGDMSAFPNIENTPLIGRKASTSLETVRSQLGLSANEQRKIILLGLRMNDLVHVDFSRIEAMRDILFIAVSRDVQLENCIQMKEGHVPFEDVLNACDAVISKPGYSMVSEVIVNQTPIVYVPRNDFAEDPVLIEGLQKYAVSEVLSQEDYFAGNWCASFDRLFAKPKNWPEIAANGAEVIAKKVLGR
jgi:UDP:flavonoid glycosyltransferase YjiC (YdhE family)